MLDSRFKLCLKDLSKHVTKELSRSLELDQDVEKRVCQAFGLKLSPHRPDAMKNIFELFPDTPVRLLRDVFEALQLYDLVELLEKAKPRSLRPALPLEEIRKLRKNGDCPTIYHSQAAVLFFVQGNDEIVQVEKIKEFFKELNSDNETAVVSLEKLQETLRALVELRQRERSEKSWNRQLKRMEVEREQLEKMIKTQTDLSGMEYLAEEMEPRWRRMERTHDYDVYDVYKLEETQENELKGPKEMKLQEEMKEKEKQKEEEIHNVKTTISTNMDRWIQNEGWSHLNNHKMIFPDQCCI